MEVSKTLDLGSNPSTRAYFLNFVETKPMNKVTTYIKESIYELSEKVTWPTGSELQQTTSIVLIATLILTGMVWLMDFISTQVLQLIYSFFK